MPLFPASDLATFQLDSKVVSQYPDASHLQQAIAERHQVAPEQIVITAGGDEAIDRTIRVCLRDRPTEQRIILTHHPTFEMFQIYANSSAGKLVGPNWFDGPFPLDEFTRELGESVALAALVSPNNPTGQSIDSNTL